jgi:cytoskeletal protein CcmA (bactofilin family)
MFERGKKEEELEDGSVARPAEVARKYESTRPAAAGPGGDCAVIGRSIEINGQVRGNEDLRIDGDVSGTVELRNSNLTIGREGKVKADIYAKSIVVDGTTEGDLYASERVSVHVNAQVRGNITAPKVGIEEGSKFKGTIEMDQDAVEKALGKSNAQSSAKPVADRPATKSVETRPAPKGVARESGANLPPPTGVA